jgi:hypothetical protein
MTVPVTVPSPVWASDRGIEKRNPIRHKPRSPVSLATLELQGAVLPSYFFMIPFYHPLFFVSMWFDPIMTRRANRAVCIRFYLLIFVLFPKGLGRPVVGQFEVVAASLPRHMAA